MFVKVRGDRILVLSLAVAFLLSACGGGSGSSKEANDDPTVTHKGFTYGIVTSPITGKKWLDRNLGAKEVCTKSRGLEVLKFDGNDYSTEADASNAYIASQKDCFGDLYQWGRLADGHEKTTSSTTTTKLTNISSAGNSFITNSSSPHDWVENSNQDSNDVDDNGTKRETQWSKTDGSSICPVGFRTPTFDELKAETVSYAGAEDEATGAIKITNRDTAFKNFLKFPASGYRYKDYGSVLNQGFLGMVWSSSPDGPDSRNINFNGADAHEDWDSRANGFSVRCIED